MDLSDVPLPDSKVTPVRSWIDCVTQLILCGHLPDPAADGEFELFLARAQMTD